MKRPAKKIPCHKNTQSGFTLLELLVSIVLIGLIVVSSVLPCGCHCLDKGEKGHIGAVQGRPILWCRYNRGTPKTTGATVDETNGISLRKKDSLRFASNYSLMGGQKGYVIVATGWNRHKR
jgi:prepilin-type N-terminal cleavage/methylation domain-containing protein